MALTEKEQLAAENDQRLKQVEKDIAKLQEAPAQIKELGAQMGKLMQYYYGPWRDDREELDKAGKGQYGVFERGCHLGPDVRLPWCFGRPTARSRNRAQGLQEIVRQKLARRRIW